MPRYNRSRNPCCASNTSNWHRFSSGSVVRDSGLTVGTTGRTTAGRISVAGSFAAGFSCGSAAASSANGGQTWSYTIWVLTTAARTVRHGFGRISDSGTFVGSSFGTTDTSVAANTWTQLRGVATIPSGSTYVALVVHLDFPTAVTSNVSASAVRIEQGNYPTLDFADGDTGGQWSWDGTAGNSSSTQSDSVPITVRTARSASTAGRPLLVQRTPLTVRAVRASTVAARAGQLTQRSALTIRTTRSATTARRALLGHRQQIAVRAACSATRAGAPALGLALRAARVATSAGRPLLAQRSVLTVRAVRYATSTSRTSLLQRSLLAVRALRAPTKVGRPQLSQLTRLVPRAARSVTRAGLVSIRFQSGRAVRVPTTAEVSDRYGTADVRTRFGTAVPRDRAATVAVDTRGLITVREAHGSVLETTD